MILTQILLWLILVPGLSFGWESGHEIITAGAFDALDLWERDYWQLEEQIPQSLSEEFSYYPDVLMWGRLGGLPVDVKTREDVAPYIYGYDESNNYAEPKVPENTEEFKCDPVSSITVYHLFDWDGGDSNITALYGGAYWYFEKAVASFREGSRLKAAQYLGSFAHAVEDATYPFRALEGLEGDESRDHIWADSDPCEDNARFWKFDDSGITVTVRHYSPVLLGTTPETAAQETVERVMSANLSARGKIQNLADYHKEEDWEHRKAGPDTLRLASEMADESARLVADIFHTAFYLAFLADTDSDGEPDVSDNCPLDPLKTVEGQCGCGEQETDSDNDEVADCKDGCPQDANKTDPGTAGCGVPDLVEVGPGQKVYMEIGQAINLFFWELSSDGEVLVSEFINPSTPDKFRLVRGSSYEIDTTAMYTGQIKVCLSYEDEMLYDAKNEEKIRLFHYDGLAWEDITSAPVDTVNNTVCGTTDSLSPFILLEPESTDSSRVPILNGMWFVAAICTGAGFLWRKRKNVSN